MTKSTKLMIGHTIDGRYRIDSILGSGGMGAVFRATHLTLDRPVAIKMIHSYLANPETRERFNREARAMVAFSHPGAVTVFDFGEWEGRLFLVMEFLEGESLKAILKEHFPLPLPRVIELMRQLCDSLEAAHRAGLVHRDLKPENIQLFVDNQGREQLKLIDFGLAIESETIDDLSEGGLLGTPRYMSPEQVRNQPLDGRSDLYSAGIILYEMLCGEPPFSGDNRMEVVYKQVTEEPQAPSARRPDLPIPKPLEALALWMIAKNPHARPQTMTEVATQIDAAWKQILPDERKKSLKGVARDSRQAIAGITSEHVSSVSAANAFPIYLIAGPVGATSLRSVLTPHGFELRGPNHIRDTAAELNRPGIGIALIDLRGEAENAVELIVPFLTNGTLNGNPALVIGSAQAVGLTNRVVELGLAGFVPESTMLARLPKLLGRIVKRMAKKHGGSLQ